MLPMNVCVLTAPCLMLHYKFVITLMSENAFCKVFNVSEQESPALADKPARRGVM